MNLSQFREKTEHLPGDLELKVYIKGGIGGSNDTPVVSCGSGFDWDYGKLFLKTLDKIETEKDLEKLRKYSSLFEKLLAVYAQENQMEHHGIKLSNGLYPKGSFARICKQIIKENIDEYLK
jgi:hypothetical protein